MVFEVFEIRIVHRTGCMFPDRFEYVLNSHVMALELAWHDRAAIEHDRRQVQSSQSHHRTGDRLVAAREGHHAVKRVSASHEFDRIGNHLPADQRGLHALGAHRNTVRHGDRVVFDGGAACGSDPGLHPLRQSAEVEVAGHDLDPGIGDTDDRTRQVLIGKSDGFHHGAGRCTIGTGQHIAAYQFQLFRHNFPLQADENAPQLRSQSFEPLNVPSRVRLGVLSPCGLAGRHFDQPGEVSTYA